MPVAELDDLIEVLEVEDPILVQRRVKIKVGLVSRAFRAIGLSRLSMLCRVIDLRLPILIQCLKGPEKSGRRWSHFFYFKLKKMQLSAIEQAVTPVLEQEKAELVDLKFVQEGHRWVLKVFLDKAGGITLDDCAYFSDRIGGALDESNVIGKSYVLEVSSPGIDRVVKKEKDFRRFTGQTVKVRLKLPQNGQRNFKGRLLGFEDGKVIVESEGKSMQFAIDQIDEARLDPEVDI